MGHTLGELMGKFAAATDTDTAELDSDQIYEQALEDGQDKTASDGGNTMEDGMGSLASLYLNMTEMDKTAGVVAGVPEGYEEGEPQLTENDLEKIAEAEAVEWQQAEEGQEDPDMMKVAAEYDAAGRIMARGFFDEYAKIASGAMDTMTADNQGTESESQSATPSFGQRGLPTLSTNYAGSPQAGIKGKVTPISMAGGKEVYQGSLKPKKTRSAGDTGDDPEANAIATGGGSPSGFATVRDVMDSNR